MQLDHCLERSEEQQLIILAALDPILPISLALQGARLGVVEQNTDGACVVIRIEELASLDLNLISYIAVASRQTGAPPNTTAGAATATSATARGAAAAGHDLASQLHDGLAEFGRVCALNLLVHLAILENDEGRERGDAILRGNVLEHIGVDLGESDGVDAGGSLGKLLENRRDGLARAAPVGIDWRDSDGQRRPRARAANAGHSQSVTTMGVSLTSWSKLALDST